MGAHQNKFLYSNFSNNILIPLFRKFQENCKAFSELLRHQKPLKIVEIISMSDIPGETKFVIQIANKNSIISLSAGDLILGGYDLNHFSDFHAEMIRQAVTGNLMQYLAQSEKKQSHRIISKKYIRELQEYIFTIENKKNETIARTVYEITADKDLLYSMEFQDIFDVGYTVGSESVLKERKLMNKSLAH